MGFQALCDWDAIEVHGPNEAVEEMSIISIGNDPALLRCLRMIHGVGLFQLPAGYNMNML